ncbi:MAG: LSU ribosomal protein L32p @ LSU ribosomal protein L32p, zinc-dependent, partial [uncultured Rubrobacteraceae bacterium]
GGTEEEDVQGPQEPQARPPRAGGPRHSGLSQLRRAPPLAPGLRELRLLQGPHGGRRRGRGV